MRLSIPSNVALVFAALERRGHEAFVVGGCVRDALMGRVPNDWDICTSALPQQVKEAMAQEGFVTFDTGIRHGTVSVHVNHQTFEVTTYRSDGSYSDGRHPDQVVFVPRVEEDLARRDFTINAMAYNPTRGLVDVFGGRQDLCRGIIRCVGDAQSRFREDGLRIVRALRFSSVLGFSIEPSTGCALRQCAGLLDAIAGERLSVELFKLLCGKDMASVLLEYGEVVAAFLPQVGPMIGLEQHNPYHCYDVWEHCVRTAQTASCDPLLRLACLLHDVGKPACATRDERGVGHFKGHPTAGEPLARQACNRLCLAKRQADTVCKLVRWHDHRSLPTTDAGLRRLALNLGVEDCRMLFQVVRADLLAHSSLERENNLARLEELRRRFEEVVGAMDAFCVKDLALSGHDLMDGGMSPGPALGECLRELFEKVVDGELPNSRDELLEYAANHWMRP